MITVSLREVIESTQVLQKLAQKSLRGRAAFQISKLLKQLENELELFNTTRMNLIQKYGEKDENGELAREEGTDNIKLMEDKIVDFNNEFNELLNSKIEINGEAIKLEDIENEDFTPAEMSILMPFISE